MTLIFNLWRVMVVTYACAKKLRLTDSSKETHGLTDEQDRSRYLPFPSNTMHTEWSVLVPH